MLIVLTLQIQKGSLGCLGHSVPVIGTAILKLVDIRNTVSHTPVMALSTVLIGVTTPCVTNYSKNDFFHKELNALKR